MGPPSYMRSVFDRNVAMRCILYTHTQQPRALRQASTLYDYLKRHTHTHTHSQSP